MGPSFMETGASALSGKVKVNCEPWPSLEVTDIVPPCNSTSCLVTERPKPVPPYSRAVEASTCSKDRNTASNLSSGMPMPVSVTVIAT
ncbi:hypothetical protein BGP_6406 [Beggiatoa sp. PS]|nr:hypothetical protein BGP_6406 [Beggiatoa sp. PS]